MRELHLSIPRNWGEITPKQLSKIARLLSSGLTRQEVLLKALFIATGLLPIRRGFWFDRKTEENFHWYKIHGQKHLLSDGQVHASARRLEFLLDLVTECNPPSILGRYPEKRQYNTRFESYLLLENYYAAYDSTKESKYLNLLVAVSLIRRYRPWKEKVVADLLAFFSHHKKYAFYLWYSGFRWYCRERFPHLYKVDPSAESSDFRDHILNMVRCLNKGDITKNDSLMRSKLFDALHELEATCKLNDELKKK